MQKSDNRMKVLIMHENIVENDAVGTDIEVMFRMLSRNHECRVFGSNKKNPNVAYVSEDEARERYIRDEDALIIYHLSVYWEKGHGLLKEAKGKIVIRYHNITPAHFFKGISTAHYEGCRLGRRQAMRFQEEFPEAFWMPASGFNARDLWKVEKERISVVPPFN